MIQSRKGTLLQKYKLLCHIATQPEVVTKSLKVALVVGVILNLINQGEALFALSYDEINFFKLVLTFFVPYSVSTYTAVSIKRQFHISTLASVTAELECRNCNEVKTVQAGEIIPSCHICGNSTRWELH